MHQSVEQLAQMVTARGLEWLRQSIMDLPENCGPDHPNLLGLASVARAAPVLSGFRGRISPLEVIVKRRASPSMVREAAQRCLDGARDRATMQLVQAGTLLSPQDPIWQMACHTLARDGNISLARRLGLDEQRRLEQVAERALTLPQLDINPEQVAAYSRLVIQMYELGAARPRLADVRSITIIYDNLCRMAEWGIENRCTASVAWTAFSLKLIDPDHDTTEAIVELMQYQLEDGSFPSRLAYSREKQDFNNGVFPTLLTVMALHAAIYRRWRGKAAVPVQEKPLHAAAKLCAEAAIQKLGGEDPTLEQAAVLGQVTGRDWIGRLGVSYWVLTPAQSVHLAALCFRDPISARHVRSRISLHHIPDLDDTTRAEVSWLHGRPVVISEPLPATLLADWQQAAVAADTQGFMRLARLASHYHIGRLPDAIHTMARQMAAKAIYECPTAPLDETMTHIQQLNLLAQLFEPAQLLEAAA